MPDIGPSIDDLRDVVRSCPGIDNHAHNLVLPHFQAMYSLLSAATEATGPALEHAPRSLPHLRMVRQLRELYGCDEIAGWDELMSKREQILAKDANGLFRQCFQDIHTILMDDGLDGNIVHPYSWHDQFTTGKTFRIVRIEAVAAEILQGMHQTGQLQIRRAITEDEYCAEVWIAFLEVFETTIANYIRDDEVVGFKSVICYRSGLEVAVGSDVDITNNGLDAFRDDFLHYCLDSHFRIESKGLNDCILISTCRLLTAGYEQTEVAKPLQFHTGLGDRDISLLRSDPAYLQPLIEKFPNVQFVLLHSSYPYTRQAGYLATVFKNVYLDLGEVFPMVSRDGQEHIIRQAMELTPMSKLLFSTDAHHWAEIYWLANEQFRQVFEKVLVTYVESDDLTTLQAIDAARDIYFNNANRIYNLNLDLPELKKTPLQLSWKEDSQTTPTIIPAQDGQIYDKALLQPFEFQKVQFVYVQWLDLMATMRTRILPYKEFVRMIDRQDRIAIARGNTGTLQNDGITAAVNPQGQIFVEPDLLTLKHTHSKDPLSSATVMASFKDEGGSPSSSCPRSSIQRLTDKFEKTYDVDLLAGFEIELVLLRRRSDKNNMYSHEPSYEASDTNHAWSTLTTEQHAATIPILAEIVNELSDMGIHVQQFHSESGAGQYELVLPPLPMVTAVDTLLQARQVVFQIAHSHNLRATLHPTPLSGAGSGQHVHISLNSDKLSPAALEEKEMSFFASVLEHLPSICAFSLPNEVSYERVKDDIWTGGTWCCWGTQNREVPLRRVGRGRWEIRCLDGFANSYLALSAILAAGLLGLKRGTEMKSHDCLENPARLSEATRQEMGIVKRMPKELDEALKALDGDHEMEEVLDRGLIKDYLVMKRAEKEMLNKMSSNQGKVWLFERY